MNNSNLIPQGIPAMPGAAPSAAIPELPRLGASSMEYIPSSALESANLFDAPTFPEIYFLIQPHIMLMCDRMAARAGALSQQMLDEAVDSVFSDVTALYPDIAEYTDAMSISGAAETARFDRDRRPGRPPGRPFRPGGFRRRGPTRDFINLLLLNEFLRRGILF